MGIEHDAHQQQAKGHQTADIAQREGAGEVDDLAHASVVYGDDSQHSQNNAHDALAGDHAGGVEHAGLDGVVLGLFGGILGIILSFGIGLVFSMLAESMRMIFSVMSIVLAVTCSTLIGVIFGYLPAKNAAKLDPIVALARE